MHIPGIIDIGIRSDLHEFTFGSPMPWASMTKHDKNIMNRPLQGSEYTHESKLAKFLGYVAHGEQASRRRLTCHGEELLVMDEKVLKPLYLAVVCNKDVNALFDNTLVVVFLCKLAGNGTPLSLS